MSNKKYKNAYNIYEVEIIFYESISEFYNVVNIQNVFFCFLFLIAGAIVSYFVGLFIKLTLQWLFGVNSSSHPNCSEKYVGNKKFLIPRKRNESFITYFRIIAIQRIFIILSYYPFLRMCYKILTKHRDIYYLFRVTIILVVLGLYRSPFFSGFLNLLNGRIQRYSIITHPRNRRDVQVLDIGWCFTSCREVEDFTHHKNDQDNSYYEISIPNSDLAEYLKIKWIPGNEFDVKIKKK